MKALKLISLLLIVSSYSFGQNHTTKKNHIDIWSNASAWNTTRPNPLHDEINDAIEVNGYVTSKQSLSFANANDSKNIIIKDTLVVEGEMRFGNKAMNLIVEKKGLLIVMGNFITNNQIEVENGGIVVIKGDMNFNGGQSGSAYTNNGGSLYTGGNVNGNNTALASKQPIDNLLNIQGGIDIWDLIMGKSSTLPIRLASFSGIQNNNLISLSFSTLSEENFDYFTIERSTDAKIFEEIGNVKGSGWSQSKKDYSFTDAQPLPGVNYYRLKAVDFDGYIEYFAPIAVFNNNVQLKVATLVGDHQLRIFSNLSAEAKIYNLQGLPVHSGTITSGVNDINLPATVSNGYYIVGIYAGNELVKKEKILVQ